MKTEEQFEILWSCYPRRIAKANARKAFVKAIKKTSLEVMLDAITKYVAHKPQWMDYKHCATWLNSEGWHDEFEVEQPNASVSRPGESNLQHRQREILMMQYRNARDEGNATEAARLRALIG